MALFDDICVSPHPFYAHVWRSLMSPLLGPRLVMPIYGYTVCHVVYGVRYLLAYDVSYAHI